MDRERILVWLLRLAGAVEILAFIAVVMPRSWMEITNAWIGLGEMPDGPLLMFMIRQASYTYGVHGLSLWLIATDVDRFRPFVVFKRHRVFGSRSSLLFNRFHLGHALVVGRERSRFVRSLWSDATFSGPPALLLDR
jgi:hypothetical protein